MIIWEYIYCVYTKESLVCTQEISCACTTLLCILWARDPRGQEPNKKALGRSRTLDRAFFGSLPPEIPGPEHAQECCACTRDLLCTHKRFFCVYTAVRNYAKLCKTMRNYAKLCETIRNYTTMKIGRLIPSKCVYLPAPARRI